MFHINTHGIKVKYDLLIDENVIVKYIIQDWTSFFLELVS